MSNDALFAIIAGAYIIGGFAVLCVVTAIIEAVSDAIERRRRRKYRNNRVYIMPEVRR